MQQMQALGAEAYHVRMKRQSGAGDASMTTRKLGKKAASQPVVARSDPADLAKLQSTRGGDSDTELNEFAVSPTKPPAAVRAVTIVTPVANMPKALRNSVCENVGAWAPDDVAIEGMAAI